MQSGEYDGVSASGDATTRLIAGGDVAPVNVDLIPNYADVFEGLKLQQHNSVDGVPVRRAPRPRRQPARLQHRGLRRRAARLVGRDVRRRHAGRRRGVRLRQPDLHRRRRRLPDGHPAGARHHQPVRPRPGAVRRRHRTARAAEGTRRAVLGAVHRPAGRARGRHRAGRHHLAGRRQPGPGQRRHHRRREARRGRHRVVRHVDDLVERRPPQLHVHVDGLDHLARGQRRGRRVLR